jgi:hypothetical protein
MARMRERIFAGFGALLFLASACAFTIFILLGAGSGSSNPPQYVATAKCDISTPVQAGTVPAPEVYKPTGPVSALEKTDLEQGSGTATKNGDCLVMKYQGSLATDGTVFDQNYAKPQALQFTLGGGQVIQGWDQGLVGMKVGGTRRLVIPYSLGYGVTGSPPSIPANADLVFIVKLIQIKK